MLQQYIGRKVIVRSDASGVHFGEVTAVSETWVTLKNSRRLFEWHTGGSGISLSEVAVCGIDQSKSRITMTLPEITVFGMCEIIPAEGMAIATIEGAAVATPS